SQDSLKFTENLAVYDDFKAQFMDGIKNLERGDPKATLEAIFKVVDAERPPLRLFLGRYNLPEIREAYNQRLKTWEAWEAVSDAAQGQFFYFGNRYIIPYRLSLYFIDNRSYGVLSLHQAINKIKNTWKKT